MAKLTTYTQTEKINCLKLYLVTGNLTAVCATLKIPYETARQWKYSKWWEDLSTEIKAEGRIELSAKLKKVAEKALGETLDRLENGDWVMSPTGELTRKPVSAAVAAKVATDFLSKHEDLDRGAETSLQGVKDRLDMLAETFEKFSKKVRKVEVLDIPDGSLDALPAPVEVGEDDGEAQTFDGVFSEGRRVTA